MKRNRPVERSGCRVEVAKERTAGLCREYEECRDKRMRKGAG